MVDGDLFDKLAKIACMLLKGHESFGGIQVHILHCLLLYCDMNRVLGYRDRRLLSATSCYKK